MNQNHFDFSVEEMSLLQLIDLRMYYFKRSTELLSLIAKTRTGNEREKLISKKKVYDSLVDYLGLLIVEKEENE